MDDVEITITIDESNDESETLKQYMYNVGRDKIRRQMGLYIKELKEEYSKGLILPKKGEENLDRSPQAKEDVKKIASGFNSVSVNTKKAESSMVGCRLDVQTLTLTEEFQCTANDLYNALTKVEMLTAFTRAPAKVDACRGGE